MFLRLLKPRKMIDEEKKRENEPAVSASQKGG